MERKVITEKQGMWDHLSVVLCKIDNPMHPWVTWIYNHTDDGYYNGHYYESFTQAAVDFETREI